MQHLLRIYLEVTVARINLSIPDELKAEMDLLTGANWSDIAREAFATQIEILKLKETDMEAAGIERLRASKKKNLDRERSEGFSNGKDWALNRAEYDELEAVAKLQDGIGGEWCARGAAYAVTEVAGDYYTNETLFGTDDDPSDEFVEGFIEGAAEVFVEV